MQIVDAKCPVLSVGNTNVIVVAGRNRKEKQILGDEKMNNYKLNKWLEHKLRGIEMNGYIGLYKGKRYEIHANTSYQAQQQLQVLIQATTRRKVKGNDISVLLAEKNGEQVIHTPAM